MATDFYKSNGSYYEAGTNKKILNPTDLRQYAIAGGKEITAPIVRSGADILAQTATPVGGLDQWKSGANLVEAARSIIQMKQGYNKDIQTAKQVWGEKARDTSAWSGDQAIFSGMSPEDQASIRAKQYAVAETHLAGLADEEKYRAASTKDTLGYISDIYKEKIQELKDQKTDANDKEKIEIDKRTLAMQEERNRILNSKDIYESGLNLKYDKDGKLVPDNSKYDIPDIGSKVQISNLGGGTITAYGSDLWQYGLDIALDGGKNADVKIPFDFTVVNPGQSVKGFGEQVQVKNNQTGQVMWVSHLSNIAGLKAGQQYAAGTSVGKQGNTGATIGKTGIHVDFTMPNGDGTYKTAEEVAVALGIGSEKAARSNLKLTDSEKKDIIAKTGLSEAEVAGLTPTSANAILQAYRTAYSDEAVDYVTKGDPTKGIKPLTEEIVVRGNVIKNPTADQIAAYLQEKYKGKLDNNDIEQIMVGLGSTKGGGFTSTWSPITMK